MEFQWQSKLNQSGGVQGQREINQGEGNQNPEKSY